MHPRSSFIILIAAVALPVAAGPLPLPSRLPALPSGGTSAGGAPWCGDVKKGYAGLTQAKELWEAKPYSAETAIYLWKTACVRLNDKALQDYAAEKRAQFLKDLGYTQEDIGYISELLNDTPPLTKVPKLADIDLAQADPVLAGLALDQAAGSQRGKLGFYAWTLDGLAQPGQMLRAAFVKACLDEGNVPGSPRAATAWALCADDAQALDRKAFLQELATSKVDSFRRLEAQLAFAQLLRRVEAFAAKQDAAGTELLQAGRKEKAAWLKGSEDARKALDAAIAVDTGLRQQKADGCFDALWPHLSRVLAEAWPGNDQELSNVFDDAIAWTVGYGLATCAKASDAGPMGPLLTLHLKENQPARGERYAIYRGVMRALPQKLADVMPSYWSDDLLSRLPSTTGSNRTPSGVVAAAKPSGDMVEVSFRADRVSGLICDKSRETNRIDRIENGKIIYRTECVKFKKITVDERPQPVRIPARFAAGIAPGRMLRFYDRDDSVALPLTVWQSKDGKNLMAVLGVTK